MHPGALRALEFDRIVEAVRRLAVTPLGAARLAQLRPSGDRRRVEQLLGATSEAVKYLADNAFPLHAPAGLDTVLVAVAIEGRALEPGQLLGLADFLHSVELTRRAIRNAARHPLPALQAIVEPLASFEAEIRDVRGKIGPPGEVLDTASPELRAVRDRLRKQRQRLRSTLESFLRGKETAKYLQDQVVTDRNGRYVLVVRAEHRGAIPGIVHGASGSGASLYLEPLSTVEINNDVVALEEQEAAEIHRILLGLTQAFRGRPADLQRAIDAATELDVLYAKARFSQIIGGIEPALAADGRLELRAARHPLLEPGVARLLDTGDEPRRAPARGIGAVPVDILLLPPSTVLIVSGPNTGGKTVALKTAGLLALMAQAGLHVPAAPGSSTTVFGSVFADIGDEQSIAANLSTFSWHVTNLVAMERALTMPALILLDEVGAGTDPSEGGALGQAVIDHFRRRGALVMATTHYDSLKSYGATTPGVAIAAFGFDPDTFEPTYRLIYGTPGRSLAFEIATRLGMPASIVQAARESQSAREAQLAEHLAQIDRDLRALEHERRLVARERAQIADDEVRLRARDQSVREREDRFRRRFEEELAARMREAQRQIDGVLDDVRRRAEALAAEAARRSARSQTPLSTGETGAVRAEARAALDSLATGVRDAHPRTPPAAAAKSDGRAPGVGDRVLVTTLGLEGVVRQVHDRDAEVEVRGKRMRVGAGTLRLVAEGRPVGGGVTVNVQTAPREGASDLNLIGCTVDQALALAEKFLDEALLAERRTVRVIHGHGTGQLRRAIGEFLHDHPLVARHATAPPEQGGSGVTVVELKD